MENMERDNEKSLEDVYRELKAIPPERLTDEQRGQLHIIEQGAPMVKKFFGALLDVMEIAAPIFTEYGKKHKNEKTGEKIRVMEYQPVLFDALKSWSKNEGKRAGVELTAESLKPYLLDALRRAFEKSPKNAVDRSVIRPAEVMFFPSTKESQFILTIFENAPGIPRRGAAGQIKKADNFGKLIHSEITHGVKYSAQKSKDGKMVEITRRDSRKKNTSVMVGRVVDTVVFRSSTSAPTIQFFVMGLSKVKKVFNSKTGEFLQDEIKFSARELVDLGMYDTEKGALYGINRGITALRSVEIYTENLNPVTGEINSKFIPLFISRGIEDGGKTLTAEINKNAPWREYLKQYAYIPAYFPKLRSNHAVQLSLHISLIARQRLKELEDDGYFYIDLWTVKEWLHLPDPDDTKSPKQDIKDEIERALNEIALFEPDGNLIIEFEQRGGDPLDPKTPIREWLRNGRLKVTMRNGKIFLALINLRNKNKRAEYRRIKRITDKKKTKGATK